MAKAAQAASSEIFQACETIFGPEVIVSDDFLKFLHPTGLKTAFRKKALATHPDRAGVLGVLAGDLTAQFIDVREAYERLLSFVEAKNKINIRSPYANDFAAFNNARSYTTSQKKGHGSNHRGKKRKMYPDHFYSGGIPRGNLMLGQYLYYAGLISWRTLIDAICWQRRQRPLIGQIALSWGLISTGDIVRILRIRTLDEKFGECALRIGYISSFEQFALVGKQRQLQRPFGQYFVDNGILSSSDLMNVAQKQQLHNISVQQTKK